MTIWDVGNTIGLAHQKQALNPKACRHRESLVRGKQRSSYERAAGSPLGYFCTKLLQQKRVFQINKHLKVISKQIVGMISGHSEHFPFKSYL